MKNHELLPDCEFKSIRYETRPVLDDHGSEVPGLHSAWIILDNPSQLNAYTTDALKEIVLAFRRASNDRAAVATVLTATGDRAFCTGGNVADYAKHYAGRPQEFLQYMRIFNDAISGILSCDKPVINRVNGLRIGGGQELGLACDYSLASDLARFGQAGTKVGSAPDGGSTDFLHLYVGWAHATESCTLGEQWSAYKASRLGLLNRIFPVLKVDGRFVPNPTVVTDRWLDEHGGIVYGEELQGEALERGRKLLKEGTIDLALLDKGVDELLTKLLYTVPGCLLKTIESMRKKKLEHWDMNKETNRSWLSLNMMTEAKAGFTAFAEGTRETGRQLDFIELRRRLAAGAAWDDELIRAISPQYRATGAA